LTAQDQEQQEVLVAVELLETLAIKHHWSRTKEFLSKILPYHLVLSGLSLVTSHRRSSCSILLSNIAAEINWLEIMFQKFIRTTSHQRKAIIVVLEKGSSLTLQEQCTWRLVHQMNHLSL